MHEVNDTDAPQFSATPGYGDTQLERMHYSQAVRIGNRVEIFLRDSRTRF